LLFSLLFVVLLTFYAICLNQTHLCGFLKGAALSLVLLSFLFGGCYHFIVVYKLQTTLRILSEMPQAQALARPDFISERIQLNEARLTEVRLRLWDLQRRLLVNNQCHLLNIQIDNLKKKKIMFGEGWEAGCICLGFPDFK